MSIQHILVHLDHSECCQSRLDYAIGLARRQQAFLTGCLALEEDGSVRGGDDAAMLGERFLGQAAGKGVAAQWVSLEGAGRGQAAEAAFCRASHCSDLVIVSQPHPRGGASGFRALPEALVLHSGRPVLILPYAGRFEPNCERIMIAWSGGRESARSLHDALTLLRQAQYVNLVSLQVAGCEAPQLDDSREMLCEHLSRHGIKPHAERYICDGVSKGDMLLNRCAEKGIDLLIAGGYSRGHLGEVARHLLKHMTVPVIMSH